MKTCFESELVHVKYDPDKNIIIGIWLTSPTSEEYREGLNAVLQVCKRFRSRKGGVGLHRAGSY
jgi:hypothetical protein